MLCHAAQCKALTCACITSTPRAVAAQGTSHTIMLHLTHLRDVVTLSLQPQVTCSLVLNRAALASTSQVKRPPLHEQQQHGSTKHGTRHRSYMRRTRRTWTRSTPAATTANWCCAMQQCAQVAHASTPRAAAAGQRTSRVIKAECDILAGRGYAISAGQTRQLQAALTAFRRLHSPLLCGLCMLTNIGWVCQTRISTQWR